MHKNIKEGIDGRPVSWYDDVFQLVFPDIDAAEANALWKKELSKSANAGAEKDDDDGSQRSE